jgi:hypothetical protein
MKTVKDAAERYVGMGTSLLGPNEAERNEISAFRAGAKFAQRWISIDEDLPEENSNVIVKVFPSGCQGKCHHDIALFRGGNFYINNYPDRDVSFWRQIKLK